MPDAVVVIPARWASSRFPGKVLAPLGGRPLLVHVCERAARARKAGSVLVATDDTRILETAEAAGFPAVMTAAGHASGTDRVAEAVASRSEEIVIGLQADEPFVDPRDLDALVACLERHERASLATLAADIEEPADYADPNVVKVVTTAGGRALYFSRSPIPYHRPGDGGELPRLPPPPPPGTARAHVGVYAWRRESLLSFTAMPPSPLERLEGLEQLRALEAGWEIRVLAARAAPLGVDTPEDLRRAEARLATTDGRNA